MPKRRRKSTGAVPEKREEKREEMLPAEVVPKPTGMRRAPPRAGKTQLIGVHLSTDVGKQIRMIAAEEDTDVKTLLIEAINLPFKTRNLPLVAADPRGR